MALGKRFIVDLTDASALSAPSAGQPGEVLYETDRTRVSRVGSDGEVGRAIRKETLGRGAVERTRHELRMLDRVAGLPGVPQLATVRGADELLVDDVPGITLADLIRANVADFAKCLDFAVELSRVVAAVHRVGVVHRDINPANVMMVGLAA